MSIEITGGESWQHTYGDILTATAVEHGAVEWRWLHRTWGVIFEVAFSRERSYDRWRDIAGVRAAFDNAPAGVVFHRGWGGTSGSSQPRKPRPIAGAGAAELEFGSDDPLDDAVDVLFERVREGLVDDPRTAAATV